MQIYFRSHQRVFDASGMGKIFDSRIRHIRDRSLYRMPDRYVSSDTEFEVSERRPDERIQRHCVKFVHGTG